MARVSSAVVGKMLYQTKYIKIFETMQKSNDKIILKKLQNATINLSSYIFRVHTPILLAPFFIDFVVKLLPTA